jgi:NADPH-dependent glutamate synthase beta subunit-like oxidoreductase
MARGHALEVVQEPGAGKGALPKQAVAPCAMECPLGLCIQGYAGHVAAGQVAEALDLIMNRCPLPDSVCRVCHRPCEPACVHADVGRPVAINDLKRFVMDWAAETGAAYAPEREEPHGRRVAIVGAGPAGLAAAHDLALAGYGVRLLDAAPEPGGLLRTGIPPFRLPPEALGRDVDRILGLGVEFLGGRALGRDLSATGLLDEGFDAVFLAVGAGRAQALDLAAPEGGGGPSVVDALAYLAVGGPATGRRVVVLGGGNAAIDAARTARRDGASSVTVAYRRRRGEMPALADEIVAAEEEGVELLLQVQPLALTGSGLRLGRTEPGPVDASGRSRPRLVEGSQLELEADQVIVAIGQSPAPDLLAADDLELARAADGSLVVDPETGRTSHPRIFAGGDVVPGLRAVTTAIAAGQRAAWAIDRELRGEEAAEGHRPAPRVGGWPVTAWTGEAPRVGRADRAERQRPAELPVAERLDGFAEVVATLTEEQARSEGARCSTCGLCGNCRACLDLFGCPAFYLDQGRIFIDPALCTGCGVCEDFCPNRAIHPAGDDAP